MAKPVPPSRIGETSYLPIFGGRNLLTISPFLLGKAFRGRFCPRRMRKFPQPAHART